MITIIDVENWNPRQVVQWLEGIRDDSHWLKTDLLMENHIGGSELLAMSPGDLKKIGVDKVDLQEHIMESIEKLRAFTYSITEETLQVWLLRLGCYCKSLQHSLARFDRIPSKEQTPESRKKSTISSPNNKDSSMTVRQRVSLDTLTSVSRIVSTVCNIVDILNNPPFAKLSDYKNVKSILLHTSIELTSTAQRDQFVEKPNDIIWVRCKFLADYSDRIVRGSQDCLLIQPYSLERVHLESTNGLVMKSLTEYDKHIIEKIRTSSTVKGLNKLEEGDEVLQFNQLVVGWSAKKFKSLIDNIPCESTIRLTVKKPIRD